MAKRLAGRYGYPADEPFRVTLHPDRLDEPLRWRKPRRVFVNSMSDLFHPDVPFEFIDEVFAVMAMTWEHTYQILTKRPERMLEYLTNDDEFYTERYGSIMERMSDRGWMSEEELWNLAPSGESCQVAKDPPWPFPNVWLGVSVEDQPAADERIPLLLQCPAAVRFVSAEPLLTGLDLSPYLFAAGDEGEPAPRNEPFLPCVHWVIVGGESGPKARPMHPQWVRSLRDQCQAADVPFFFKQWGEWLPNAQEYGCHQEGANYDRPHVMVGDVAMCRVGKKLAGALLDGREWREFPQAEVRA